MEYQFWPAMFFHKIMTGPLGYYFATRYQLHSYFTACISRRHTGYFKTYTNSSNFKSVCPWHTIIEKPFFSFVGQTDHVVLLVPKVWIGLSEWRGWRKKNLVWNTCFARLHLIACILWQSIKPSLVFLIRKRLHAGPHRWRMWDRFYWWSTCKLIW